MVNRKALTLSKNKKLVNKKLISPAWSLLGLVWLVMQLFFLLHNGIKTDLEATKYISEAHQFLSTGNYSSGRYLFYSTQILLIAFSLKMHIGYWFVVLIQIIFNGLSLICFYKIVQQISKNSVLTFWATLYFMALFYYHLFNTFLFTESLFFSFSIIYTYVLFSTKALNLKSLLFILLFLSLLYLTRPTGIFFIPATWVYLIIRFFPKRAFKIIAIGGVAGVAGLYFLLNFSLKSGGEFDFLLPYTNEMIICGVPTIQTPHQFSIPVEKNSIQGLIYIVTHYFDLFARLAFERLSAFFGVSRSFYSLFHNIFISVYFYAIYLVILINIRYLFRNNKAKVWFMLTNIILLTMTVMLSCDEWSNRFIFAITPFLLFLAVIGISNKRNRPIAGN